MTRDETLERYLSTIQQMENFFKEFTVEHIERAKKTEADELAKAATRKTVLPPDVFFQTIEDPFVKIVDLEPIMVNIVQGEDW
jgi:O-acetylhomoserine/O-acetylserine sulfhydrylase-like pyridoxal-dependent enzyme